MLLVLLPTKRCCCTTSRLLVWLLLLLLLLLLGSCRGRFVSWTSTEPRVRPLELRNEFPWQLLAIAPTKGGSIDSYETLIVCEYANVTTNWKVIEQQQQQENDSSSLLLSLSQVLTGLRHELKTKTTAGSRSSSVLWNIRDGEQQHQRVILVRLEPGPMAARKVGTILAHLLEALPPPPSKTTTTKRKRRQTSNCCAIVLPLDLAQRHQHQHASSSSFLNGTDWLEITCHLFLGLYQDKRFHGTGKADQSHNNNNNQKPRAADVFFYKTTTTDGDTTKSTTDNDDSQSLMMMIQSELNRGRMLAKAISTCLDIVGAPHNVLNAASLAATAVVLAQHYPRTLKCQILDTNECERLGMGAFLGVARGSETQAQFIHIIYQPPPQQHRRIRQRRPLRRLAIVGKGLLFDTGGYNIKTGSGMTHMKMDCGGAAAVLGAAQAIAALEPEHVEIHFLIAACENMINERAMVPGDILTASNGKTIEVMNTDAEGRLTLADALVYADLYLQCDEIMELSTLTKACVHALGSTMAGMWTLHNDMAKHVCLASHASGEKIWRMPLLEDDEHQQEMLRSTLADLRNMGDDNDGRNFGCGGAITAALFLQQFVDRAKFFTHVDMTGPVWNYKSNQPTGWGVRFLIEWVYQRNQDAADSSV